jgi:hypothetical protein
MVRASEGLRINTARRRAMDIQVVLGLLTYPIDFISLPLHASSTFWLWKTSLESLCHFPACVDQSARAATTFTMTGSTLTMSTSKSGPRRRR